MFGPWTGFRIKIAQNRDSQGPAVIHTKAKNS
jgi:hypothetical protein